MPLKEYPKAVPMPIYLAFNRCLPDLHRELLAKACNLDRVVFGYPVVRPSYVSVMVMLHLEENKIGSTWESNFCVTAIFEKETLKVELRSPSGRMSEVVEQQIVTMISRAMAKVVPDPSFREPKPKVIEEPEL